MKRQLKKELSADLRILRNVVRDVSKSLEDRADELNSLVEQLSGLNERQLQEFPPELQQAIRFIKKNAANLKAAMDADELLTFDIGRTLDRIVTAKFDDKAAREFRAARNDLNQTRDRITTTILRLNQPEMLDPPDFILVIRGVFPPDARLERKVLGDLARHLRQAGTKNEEGKYREGVAAWTRVLSVLSTIVGIVTKWLDYGLEEWESSRQRGRSPSQEPLKGLARIREWINANPGILNLSQVSMQAVQMYLMIRPPGQG